MSLFPPHPLQDRFGLPKPFGDGEHAAFQALWERFAGPELITAKTAAISAARSNQVPVPPKTRFERAAAGIGLSQ
jgi:hypothetical protein